MPDAVAEPSWPDDLFETLRAEQVTQVAYVPDAGHAGLIARCHADEALNCVRLTTEEEGVAMLCGSAAGCSIMSPGNEGWWCDENADCKEGLRCRTYQYKGSSKTKRLCTGRKRLSSSKQTYGWFLLIAAWVMVVGFPSGLVVLVIVARIKNARKGPPQAPGGQPPGEQPPPADPPAA